MVVNNNPANLNTITDFNSEKETKDAELKLLGEQEKRQQLISYFTGGGLLLSLIFAYVIFNRLQLTRKQKED